MSDSSEDAAVSVGLSAGKFEVVLRGGSPWGFTLQGGEEVQAPLTVAKVIMN